MYIHKEAYDVIKEARQLINKQNIIIDPNPLRKLEELANVLEREIANPEPLRGRVQRQPLVQGSFVVDVGGNRMSLEAFHDIYGTPALNRLCMAILQQ